MPQIPCFTCKHTKIMKSKNDSEHIIYAFACDKYWGENGRYFCISALKSNLCNNGENGYERNKN